MVILNKKRIIAVALLVAVAFLVPNFKQNTNETIETVALPVSNKVIVLDAGHRLSRYAGLKVQMEQLRI